jgi:hypothetical protein
MSEVSGLSYEYTGAAELSASLNGSLIVLKKSLLKLPGAERIQPDQILSARQTLATILRILVLLLRTPDEAAPEPVVEASARIPPAFVVRLHEEWRGSLTWRLQDLESIADRLARVDRQPTLTAEELERLDDLARAAEAETSKVFRLMMRGT